MHLGVRDPKLERVLEKFTALWEGELGTFNKGEVALILKPEAKPVYCPPRALAFALRNKVDEELDRLVRVGILHPVDFSAWATPIVPVAKNDGSVRICGDFKITLNPNLQIERYPLPRVDEIFAKLEGGEKFSTIDLAQAFQQLTLDEGSQELCTINIHRGLFRYCRLPFGVASAPAIFQRIMDQVMQGLKGAASFQDDIIVTGRNDKEHLENLDRVLNKLCGLGFKVNRGKCRFMEMSVEYLGHKIDREGLHPTISKVEAITKCPPPRNVSQLRAFLGLIEYYSKFLPNLATRLAPLHELLRKESKWDWSEKCEEAFQSVKTSIASAGVLAHYNPSLPIILECDASPYGLGALLIQRYTNGLECPIAFASRSLSKAETNYAQIDREALAIIFGVKKFTQYLYGRKFTLRTDHKPLLYILGEKKGIPQMAANRLQRWAIILQGYDFQIKYIKATENRVADGLSRLPLREEEVEIKEFSYIELGERKFLPVTVKRVRQESQRDPLLAKVLDYCMFGWPVKGEENVKPYFNRKMELSVEQGCLMWGNRVVIPEKLRPIILNELHASHQGIVKMKSVARSYVWWPKLDEDLEALARACTACAENKPLPNKAHLKCWERPDKPWVRLHIDLAGPFMSKVFLVVVDSSTKWPEVFQLSNSSSEEILGHLRALFATFGLPEEIVSDNGTPFTSWEFQNFCSMNGIRHRFSPPYRPATNGAAENLVKCFKSKIKTLVNSNVPLHIALQRFLFDCRISPHSTTGEPPSLLMFGRVLRSRLSLLKPSINQTVTTKQEHQKRSHGTPTQLRTFNVGDKVWATAYTRGGARQWK
ncbi:uncharacterized protein K02A2.6-like [Ischnura elegans]|uniref:uncharacterized protein K02A2.6-like n=1 Tax=Ischnura elegans TaxID=197161 RepID=UPI001ED86C2D|nr:uncharacterized protein K02A2.6-like [Ischnura elegans]